MTDRSTPPLRAVRVATKCPICGKPDAADYRPFCSKRCADVDLGRWLKEGYRIETEEGPVEDQHDDQLHDPRKGGGPTGQRR